MVPVVMVVDRQVVLNVGFEYEFAEIGNKRLSFTLKETTTT